MRHLAGGVSVITAGRGKDITGMTVTSVSSLSVDPPSLVVSINRASSSWPLLKRHGFFGVNILTADQLEVAERFTGKGGLKGAERFAGAAWTTRGSGVPLLVGALAAIDCEAEDIIERHSHAIVIGRVLDLRLSSRTAALAYWQGQYVAIDQNEDALRLAEVSVPAPRERIELHTSLGRAPERWRFSSQPKSFPSPALREPGKQRGTQLFQIALAVAEFRLATTALSPLDEDAIRGHVAGSFYWPIGALAIGYLALYAYAGLHRTRFAAGRSDSHFPQDRTAPELFCGIARDGEERPDRCNVRMVRAATYPRPFIPGWLNSRPRSCTFRNRNLEIPGCDRFADDPGMTAG